MNHSTQTHVITPRAVASWAVYDLANTIFSLGIVSLYFSLYLRNQTSAESVDGFYGIVTAISMGVIFLVSPILGAITDKTRRRMPFLIASTLICVGLTCLLARVNFYATIICFIFANIAYQAGLQFYDALLPEVSTEANRGRISGLGVGIGYIGSYLPLVIYSLLNEQVNATLFTLIAMAFLIFAVPCFLFVPERGNPAPQKISLATVTASLKETWRTLRASNEFPGLARFLFGRVFYTDAINTLITVMGLYTVNVAVASGLTEAEGQSKTTIVLGLAITFAIAGGFFWGWLVDKTSAKKTLLIVLQTWIAIFLFASLIGFFNLGLSSLYVVAAAAGFCLGGVWAADRPLMLDLTPPQRVGEFYGLYGMVGRFSAITGPVIWAVVTSLAINIFNLSPLKGQSASIVILSLLVLMSFVILRKVAVENKP